MRRLATLLLSVLATCTAASAGASRAPSPHAAQAGFYDVVVADSIENPVSMAIAPDGRIFVCEQGGALRLIKNGVLLAKPFLVAPVYTYDEQGLLGVALHPNSPATATCTSATRR